MTRLTFYYFKGIWQCVRFFSAAMPPFTVAWKVRIALRGATIGVNICEDIWFPDGPTRHQAAAGADAPPPAAPIPLFRAEALAERIAERSRLAAQPVG